TLLLYWLWSSLDIEKNMYAISQTTGIDIQTLLRTSMRKNLVNSLYRVDPILSTYDIETNPESSMTKSNLNVYRNVYICSYGRWFCNFLRNVDLDNSEIYKSI